MRSLLLVIAAGALVACGSTPDAPARGPDVPSASQAASPAPVAASTLPPQGSPAAPLVAIGTQSITLDGKLVGSVTAIDHLGQPEKLDELYQELRARRSQWEAAHPGVRFSGMVNLGVAPTTSGNVLSSTLQTIAFSGLWSIHVLVGSHYTEIKALVPHALCEGEGEECPPDPLPAAGARIVHAQADQKGWRLRVPHDTAPLELHEEESPQSLEHFRSALARLPPSETVGALVLHVSGGATFSALAPFLDALATFAQQKGVTGGVLVSTRDIDYAPPPPQTPEVAEIQRVVRAAFGKLRLCYEEALKKDPKAEGKVEIRFVIGTDGTVSSAQVTLTGNLPAEMAPCLQKVFVGLVFQPRPSGTKTVVYPIQFAPGG